MGSALCDPGQDKTISRHLAAPGTSYDHVRVRLGLPSAIAQSLWDLLEPNPLAPNPEAGMLATCHILSRDRCGLSLQPACFT